MVGVAVVFAAVWSTLISLETATVGLVVLVVVCAHVTLAVLLVVLDGAVTTSGIDVVSLSPLAGVSTVTDRLCVAVMLVPTVSVHCTVTCLSIGVPVTWT